MAVLHGSWVIPAASNRADVSQHESAAGFFIWGERWRRVAPHQLSNRPKPGGTDSRNRSIDHPYAMAAEDLGPWMRSLQAAGKLQWPVASLPLEAIANPKARPEGTWRSLPLLLPSPVLTSHEPSYDHDAAMTAAAAIVAEITLDDVALEAPPKTYAVLPQHSGAAATDPDLTDADLVLYPWRVCGLWLSAAEAIAFLHTLPLSLADQDSWGSDLRFWSHVSRWQLDLLTRSKFVPQFTQQSEGGLTRWYPLLDSATDQGRLVHFERCMPALCRSYDRTHIKKFPAAHKALHSFLTHTIDAQTRAIAASIPLPTAPLPRDLPLKDWLQSLAQSPRLEAEAEGTRRLASILSTWLAPVQRHLSDTVSPYRVAFVLQTPSKDGAKPWRLEYGLQALDDTTIFLDADTIWQNPVAQMVYKGRTINAPQETLLLGLGIASRLYEAIAPSLEEIQPVGCALEPDAAYQFIKTVSWQLQDSGFGVILPASLSNPDGWASRLGLAVRAQTPRRKKNQSLSLQSLLNFRWELTIGNHRISKEEFDRLLAQKSPLVEIDGEWVELRPQDIKAAQDFFSARKDQMSLSLEDALRISSGDSKMVEKLPVVDFEASGALNTLLETLTTGDEAIETVPTPKGFRGTLRPYQQRGVSWLAFLGRWGLGACLADDMGLGKTIQMIALLLHLKESGDLNAPTLLVCPTSVIGNWEREVKRFGPDLKVLVHHGDRAKGSSFVKAAGKVDLVITSYTLVYRDQKTLGKVDWQGLVLDEAQNIKNPEARQSQAVRQLSSEFRIALTGTPLENRLSELWSIIDFLNPGYLGPRNFFQRRFAIPIERYGDSASLQALRGLVQPFILRRLKTDRSIIQDLPDKQEMTVFCGLSDAQADLYQELVDRSMKDIEAAEGIQRHGQVLALLTRLKQVCDHPALLSDGEGKGSKAKRSKAKAVQPEDTPALSAESAEFPSLSGKLQRLEAMLEEVLAEGDRALLFTQFAEWGKLLKTFLEERFNQEVLFLYGSTPRQAREAMVDRFQNDPQGPRLFILSLKAGGTGLNLTRANHVFHVDRWWNPAVENQATDRAFRIGQTQNVQVHKFVCSGTLEERIHEIIESKKALSEQVVGTGESWLGDFDTQQLRNLLLLDRSAIVEQEELAAR